MATFSVLPLEVITAPNYYSYIPDNRWTVTGTNQVTLWGQIQISDNLGLRRYIPITGSTLQVVFMRKDSISLTSSVPQQFVNTNQNVTANATLNATDRSMFSIVLPQADAIKLVSGSVKFTLTESGVANVWVQDWLMLKKLSNTGC